MPDLSVALETIDMYMDKYVVKPNASMTKTQMKVAALKYYAADVLKEHLTEHWFEAPASDLVFNFVKEYERRRRVLNNDILMHVIYKIAKEIFYYFI